jgi:hypothetical protein
MYSGQEIKDRFFTFWDTLQSGTFSNTKLNYIFEKAQTQYLYNIMDGYGLNLAVENEATTYLINFTAVPTSNALNVAEGSVVMPNFERLIAMALKFVKGGVTYYEYSRELKDEEKISPLKGNVRYPKYDYTNTTIRIYPENETCLEAKGLYFREIFTIDVTSVVENLPLTDKNVQGIINNALNLAAQMTREDGYYNMTEAELRQNEV